MDLTVRPGVPVRTRWRWRWLLLGILAAPVVAIFLFATLRPVKVLPRMQLAPGFALVDQDGRSLTSEALRGRAVLYTFSHAACPPPCQGLDDTMAAVQARLTEATGGFLPVSLVTISLDPARDTPEALRAWARRAGADPAVWRFATAQEPQLKQIVGGAFSVYYNADESGVLQFDPAMVLVDGAGIVRARYDYRMAAPDAEYLLGHLALLTREMQSATGPARLAYEAAHLFVCYAP